MTPTVLVSPSPAASFATGIRTLIFVSILSLYPYTSMQLTGIRETTSLSRVCLFFQSNRHFDTQIQKRISTASITR
jgi:hypothetical protein